MDWQWRGLARILAKVLQRTEPSGDRQAYIYYRNWLMWFWWSPTVCCQQDGEPGKLAMEAWGFGGGGQWCKSYFKSQDPRTRNVIIWGQEKMNVPAQPESKLPSSLAFFFHSGPQQRGGSSPTLVRVSSFLRILIQMLTSCRNNFTDTSRNKQLHGHMPAIWASLA